VRRRRGEVRGETRRRRRRGNTTMTKVEETRRKTDALPGV